MQCHNANHIHTETSEISILWRTLKTQLRIEYTCELWMSWSSEEFFVVYCCFVPITIAIFLRTNIELDFTQFRNVYAHISMMTANTFDDIQCSQSQTLWPLIFILFFLSVFAVYLFTSVEAKLRTIEQWVAGAPRFFVLRTLWLTQVD